MTHRWLPDTAGYAVMWTPRMVSIFQRNQRGGVDTDAAPVCLSLDEFAEIGRATMLAENRHVIEQEINFHATSKEPTHDR